MNKPNSDLKNEIYNNIYTMNKQDLTKETLNRFSIEDLQQILQQKMSQTTTPPSGTVKQLVTHFENKNTEEPIIEDYSVPPPISLPRPKRKAQKLLWKSVF